MSKARKQVQEIGLTAFLVKVEGLVKEGYSVVSTTRVGESPAINGKWFTCFMDKEAPEAVIREEMLTKVKEEQLDLVLETEVESKEACVEKKASVPAPKQKRTAKKKS